MTRTSLLYETLLLLDDVREQIVEGQFYAAMDRLRRDLQILRSGLPLEEWQHLCHDVFPRHEIQEIVHQGPITRRCYEKPHGYPDDGVTTRLIYGFNPHSPNLTSIAGAMYAWEYELSAFASMRARRDIFERELEETCRTPRNPRILSINNGYLHEAKRILRNYEVGEFLVVDRDRENLRVIDETYSVCSIQTFSGQLADVTSNRNGLGTFDFIYSANLFDESTSLAAHALVRDLTSMLKPKGRLILSNFSPDLSEAGYFEACMDWWPLYRNEEQMAGLTRSIDQQLIGGHFVYRDDFSNIVFLEVHRS